MDRKFISSSNNNKTSNCLNSFIKQKKTTKKNNVPWFHLLKCENFLLSTMAGTKYSDIRLLDRYFIDFQF